MKYFIAVVSTVIGAIVVTAFFYVGSPKEVRLRDFDQLKVQHLSAIQAHVLEYWQAKETVPESLDVLPDELRYIEIPVDPQTNESYEYSRLSEVSFKLCATFNLASDNDEALEQKVQSVAPYNYLPFGKETTWGHEEGRTCFERTIDPDFFKKNK